MDTLSRGSFDFTSLSLKDLLQARDLFHYHLMNKKNVVATAVGLYRIRHDDPWPSEKSNTAIPARSRSPGGLCSTPRCGHTHGPAYTFLCRVGRRKQSYQKTRPRMSCRRPSTCQTGGSAPVCVIEARQQAYAEDMEVKPRKLSPRNFFGPGVPILNNAAQGLKKIATGGCLVKDGDFFYVLTNKHPVGAPGTVIRAMKKRDKKMWDEFGRR
jgi:hypothetical protein